MTYRQKSEKIAAKGFSLIQGGYILIQDDPAILRMLVL